MDKADCRVITDGRVIAAGIKVSRDLGKGGELSVKGSVDEEG